MRWPGRCSPHFYSRPCGRGDTESTRSLIASSISTHAPAGGATPHENGRPHCRYSFLLTPLREGRPLLRHFVVTFCIVFLLTPLREGRHTAGTYPTSGFTFLLTPLREGRRSWNAAHRRKSAISTHAPAGGATAIFHKSVMRFCGKLPKDDTVLCLASFGFPGRDPKAVYLAWISCANLPQKCVREGLALKDQGTSCFHEGLASHAFDPVLV